MTGDTGRHLTARGAALPPQHQGPQLPGRGQRGAGGGHAARGRAPGELHAAGPGLPLSAPPGPAGTAGRSGSFCFVINHPHLQRESLPPSGKEELAFSKTDKTETKNKTNKQKRGFLGVREARCLGVGSHFGMRWAGAGRCSGPPGTRGREPTAGSSLALPPHPAPPHGPGPEPPPALRQPHGPSAACTRLPQVPVECVFRTKTNKCSGQQGNSGTQQHGRAPAGDGGPGLPLPGPRPAPQLRLPRATLSRQSRGDRSAACADSSLRPEAQGSHEFLRVCFFPLQPGHGMCSLPTPHSASAPPPPPTAPFPLCPLVLPRLPPGLVCRAGPDQGPSVRVPADQQEHARVEMSVCVHPRLEPPPV